MQIPKAIFFDLDDTLMSFNGASEIAWKMCCDNFVHKNSVCFDSSEMLKIVEITRDWYWSDPERHKIGRRNIVNSRREIMKMALNSLDFKEDEKINESADYYTTLQEHHWKLFDGIPESLETLKRNNISMAVITNGITEIQNGKLERFGIRHYFEHVICESEAGYSKPDAEIFNIALYKLSLLPKDVWMIGDNLVWDIFGAQRLGIFAVWNDYERRGLPQDSKIIPNMTVNSVYEMVNYIIPKIR